MKNVKKLIVVLVMALVFTGVYLPQSSMSYASESSDVTQMLNAYKKHHYVTAEKYAKKLKSTRDASEKRMTYSMKKAFKKSLLRKNYAEGAYFADMDGDNKAEMLVKSGRCEADMVIRIYKYKNGKVVYVGKFKSIHSDPVNYPGHRGIILRYCQMSSEMISTVCLRNGKISITHYGSRMAYSNYLSLKLLNNHRNFNGDKWILGF